MAAVFKEDAARVNGKSGEKTWQQLVLDRCSALKSDPQFGAARRLDAFLDPFETLQNEQGESHRGETQAESAGAKAQAHHDDEPQHCR